MNTSYKKKKQKQKKPRENAEEIIPQQKIVKREHNSEGTWQHLEHAQAHLTKIH